ncbi:TPA: hypothetical protein ROX88_001929 [Bacillus pseudomycoides]|nr:hypothetical protein [Bacillus pseudomycoides]
MGKTVKKTPITEKKDTQKEEKKNERVDTLQKVTPEVVVTQVVEERESESNPHQLIVPSSLKQMLIAEYEESPVYEFSKFFDLTKFEEIQDEHLRQWYRRDKQAFYDLTIQLWFLGCDYQGSLAKLVNLHHEEPKELVVVNGTQSKSLSEKFPQHLTDLFAKFGVRNTKQLNGLPVLSVRWLTMESFHEFLECLKQMESSLDESEEAACSNNETEIEAIVQEDESTEELVEMSAQDEEIVTVCMGTECLSVPAFMKDTEITTELILGCNNFIYQLREKFAIDTFGKLPNDLLPLREQLVAVGPKVIEKFFRQLVVLVQSEGNLLVIEEVGVQGEEVIWEGEHVSIPRILQEEPIEIGDFLSCPSLVEKLQETGVYQYKQLPLDLLELKSLPGIGNLGVKKFFEHFKNKVEDTKRQEEIGVQGEEVVWEGEHVSIPRILQEEPIEIGDFLSCPSLVEKLQETGVYQYKQLPLDLLELKKLPGVGNLGVKKFFEHFKNKVEDAKKQEEIASFYSHMTEEEKMHYELQKLKGFLQNLLDTDDMQRQLKINEKSLSILQERYEGTMKGKRPTLEETAQNYDVTRERVRQIVKGAVGKIKLKAAGWLESFQVLLASKQGFMENHILTDGSFCEYLLLEMLEAEDVTLCFENRFFTTFTRNDLQGFEKRMGTIFAERLKGKLLEEEEYEVVIDDIAEELEISSSLVKQLSHEMMHCTDQNQYILKKSTKMDIAEIVLRQFPNGVEVYKEYAMLNERANTLMPNSFYGERDFSAICTRDEFSEQVYLWGRGIYIHPYFVKPNEELIEMIAKEAASKLQKKPIITVTYLFNQYKDVLLENNVPTEYALYTLLRRYGLNYISLPKFPKIIQIGDTGSIRNADVIREFIRKNNRQVSTKELRDELITNRGWKPFTVEFTLSSTKDIVQSDFGYYTLLEFYDLLSEKVLHPIVQRIEEKLEELSHLQISGLFKEFESYCIANDIHTHYLLYHLLRSRFADRFMFPRYPHILKPGSDLESISITSLVESYILEQGYEVSREEALDWLMNEVGARENALDVALQHSNKILSYTRGQYAEYVHEETIGWNAEKQSILKDTIFKLLERAKSIQGNFILVEQCLSKELPELDEGLSWTGDLLVDFLKREEAFLLLGSRGTIVLEKTNENGIQSETDFIQYILVHEFGGSVKLRDMRKQLIQYNFSHDGELLFETETLLTEGKAPFVKVGDELISKHLVEV